ncbi:MAG: hypothetical protein M0Z59_10185 [Nitrospiraceae bacterium]|nr:hypothetical protein [Nitrospiraceae bacterium]
MLIKERDYVVKTLLSGHERHKAYLLRHEVFAGELRWVPETADKLEIDVYDHSAATGFGVFFKEELLAYIRFVPSGYPFMIDNEFSMLVDAGHKVRRAADTGETSRFCVSRRARAASPLGYPVFMFLLKGLYHWCLRQDTRYLYTVVEAKVLRLLCARGFPCRPIGRPVVMPDGTQAAAVILDWRAFELSNKKTRPVMCEWFSTVESGHFQSPRRLPEPCLSHQAFP